MVCSVLSGAAQLAMTLQHPANVVQQQDSQCWLTEDTLNGIACRNMMEDKDIEIKDAPKALWDAPFALLSHEFGDSEAKYDYANKVCICCVCWGLG